VFLGIEGAKYHGAFTIYVCHKMRLCALSSGHLKKYSHNLLFCNSCRKNMPFIDFGKEFDFCILFQQSTKNCKLPSSQDSSSAKITSLTQSFEDLQLYFFQEVHTWLTKGNLFKVF